MRLMEIEYFEMNGYSIGDFKNNKALALINLDYVVHATGLDPVKQDQKMFGYMGQITMVNDDVFLVREKEYRRIIKELELLNENI